MRAYMLAGLRAALVTWLLCGLAYPLLTTAVAQHFMPAQANGSLQTGADGTVVGSRLIGQQWSGPEWFHGRPSATTGVDPADPAKTVPAPYNAANSTGSNLGPTNRDLLTRLLADRQALDAAEPNLAGTKLPADMLTTSASGLDPDISPANALLQAGRVARVRNIPIEEISALIERHTTRRSLGVFGEARVNVLGLNLDLDQSYRNRQPQTAARAGR